MTGKQTVALFRQYGVFDYLREFYDILHTTGYQYISNDIDIYLKARTRRFRHNAEKCGPLCSAFYFLPHFIERPERIHPHPGRAVFRRGLRKTEIHSRGFGRAEITIGAGALHLC